MYKDKKVCAIVLAAGKGSRIGFDKMLYKLDKHPVVYHSVKAFRDCDFVDNIIVAAGENYEEIRRITRGFDKVYAVVKGGGTRAQSVLNAIEKVEKDSLIAIHDGARPFVSRKIIEDTIAGAYRHKAAIPCVKVKDTIKQEQDGFILQTIPRDSLYNVQTPQVFDVNLYREYAEKYFDENITDDSQLFEKAGVPVKICNGEYENYKITTIDDIKKERTMRIGHGYDVHKLVEGRKLIMGGVDIPYKKGLDGHSDADVLRHRIMDSLLGALALGDIGKHFPDTDPAYKGIDSMKLMGYVAGLLADKGAKVVNIDATILCQRPKLAPHIPKMRENIAAVLGCDTDRVSVKATTEEGLGFTGEGKGIACHCVCLVENR